MSHYSAKPMFVRLQPSYWLALVIALAAAASSLIMLSMPAAFWVRLTVSALLIVVAIFHIWQDALLRFPWSWASIAVNSTGSLILSRRNGTACEATIQASSFVASYLTVLNIGIGNSRWQRHLILLPDSADPDSLRRLRVWLLWGLPQNLKHQPTDTEEA
ncbi:MAG: protein YgfX [Methylophilaceae bacterium]